MNSWLDLLTDEVLRRVERNRVRPRATYRIQLSGNFTFRDSAAIVPYLHDLGISHVYCSPYLKARPGSSHGYDVCDHSQLNPELGGAEDFAEFVAALRAHDMGHLADMVPNHMSASTHNPWWADVLENGPSSPYSSFFDIDWLPVKPELADKVLLPILGTQYGEALEQGQLTLEHHDGAFFLRYFDHTLPLAPKAGIPLLTHRLDELQQSLGADHEDLVELQSIVTALEHLPFATATAAKAIAERQREKEVVKRRLRELEARSAAVAEFVARNTLEFNGRPDDPASINRLDELLNRQSYRLCHWRAAADEINYRRFFDVNELAALGMELPEVFRRSHALIGELLGKNQLDGLRIDHIDGLFSPEQYLLRLQWLYLGALSKVAWSEWSPTDEVKPEWQVVAPSLLVNLCRRCALPLPAADDLQALFGDEAIVGDELFAPRSDPAQDATADAVTSEPASSTAVSSSTTTTTRGIFPLLVVVEKILEPGEPLPETWPTAGTTGYNFMNLLNGLFVSDDGWREVQRFYVRYTGESRSFDEISHECKLLILRFSMSSELQMLAHRLNRISEQHRRTRDLTLNMLRHALREILASFPVYRIYPSSGHVSDRERRFVNLAVARARRRNPAVDRLVFDFIRDVLLLQHPAELPAQAIHDRELFAGRFQQVSSPIAAKGVEDTAFYVYCPLVSANEVGGQPNRPTTQLAAFHEASARRLERHPLALLSTSTHDTKRSGDVRARINVLSELPGLWRKQVNRWSRINRRNSVEVEGQQAPSKNDEYLFYQTLIGIWPLTPIDHVQLGKLADRLQRYMEKATHEAKQRTSWINPDQAYDDAVRNFVARALRPGRGNRLVPAVAAFHAQIVDAGLYTAISQLVLKLTSPGVPDIYQGHELWDFSLVDPDNRQPVDFELRRRWLTEIQMAHAAGAEPWAEYLARCVIDPRDPRFKLLITWRLLQLRRELVDLFLGGAYQALEAQGQKARHIVAFARHAPDKDGAAGASMIVVVPRFLASLVRDPTVEPASSQPPLGEKVWGNTMLGVEEIRGTFVDWLTGDTRTITEPLVPMSELLSKCPFAVLVSRHG